MINHLCRFTKRVLGEEEYKSIRWAKFGRFYTKPGSVKFWEDMAKNPDYIDYRNLTPPQRTQVKSIEDPEIRLELYRKLCERNSRDNILFRKSKTHDDRHKI